MFFRPRYFLDHQLLQLLVLFNHDLLENGISQGPVKATPVSASLPVVLECAQQILHLDVETLIGGKLIHEQRQGFADGLNPCGEILGADASLQRSAAIRVGVTVEDDRIVFDFAGTAPQSPGNVNAVEAVTVAARQHGACEASQPSRCATPR